MATGNPTNLSAKMHILKHTSIAVFLPTVLLLSFGSLFLDNSHVTNVGSSFDRKRKLPSSRRRHFDSISVAAIRAIAPHFFRWRGLGL